MEERNLSKLEAMVFEFYSDRKATKEECCQAVFGKVDYFYLKNLANVESRLRKKGILFYRVNGLMVNIEDEDVKTSDLLIIQKRMGGMMLGLTRANVRIIEATSDVEMRMMQREQFKELNNLLSQARETTYGRNPKPAHRIIEARPKSAKAV